MAGQFSVTERPGEVVMGQVELDELETAMPQVLLAVTVEVLVDEQAAGAV